MLLLNVRLISVFFMYVVWYDLVVNIYWIVNNKIFLIENIRSLCVLIDFLFFMNDGSFLRLMLYLLIWLFLL